MAETGLPQGTLDLLVLRTLADGEMHGFAVARRIEALTEDALRIEEGTMYPALHRLERRGLLTANWGVSENNRRAKFYRLTADGRRSLRREEDGWHQLVEAVGRVLRPEGRA
jgi:PadR family transcriptional regulator, regulatory protein PadR